MKNLTVQNFKEIRKGLGITDRIHSLQESSLNLASFVTPIQIQA